MKLDWVTYNGLFIFIIFQPVYRTWLVPSTALTGSTCTADSTSAVTTIYKSFRFIC